jgi:hypothetical protein
MLRITGLIFAILAVCAPEQPQDNEQLNWRNPQTACALLEEIGLRTRGWKNDPSAPKQYWCSSPYNDIGDGRPLPNNLAFYVDGESNVASQLKLVLNVNIISTAEKAHEALAVAGHLLTRRALGLELPGETITALLVGRSGKWKVGQGRIEVIREDWPTGKGYEVKFLIK